MFGHGEAMTFLIADDDPRSRDTLKRYISKRIPNHHMFLEASDGSAALSLFEQNPVDWVLLDIEMEPMDGLDALKALKRGHPDVKVVMVSYYDDRQYRTAAKSAGARAYIVKDRLDELGEVLVPQ